jgi:transposase InsO family protein
MAARTKTKVSPKYKTKYRVKKFGQRTISLSEIGVTSGSGSTRRRSALRAKHRASQKKEALIAVNVINRMTALGMPDAGPVVPEAKVLTDAWRQHYNHHRPHRALGYRPPAPVVIKPKFAATP